VQAYGEELIWTLRMHYYSEYTAVEASFDGLIGACGAVVEKSLAIANFCLSGAFCEMRSISGERWPCFWFRECI
jgi:hypothetical protein